MDRNRSKSTNKLGKSKQPTSSTSAHDTAKQDMFWLSLRPDLLPVIINEVDRVCEKHQGIS